MILDNKIILITGGTGSFGSAVLNRLIDTNVKEIRIFSRDEKKQDDMRSFYKNSKLKFIIGDVRDLDSLNNALYNVDYCFHAAALKQVPSCEFFPLEAFKTNVLGTKNVIDSCIRNFVSKLVCLSTDKAVYPINSMGISKAMMEKVMVSEAIHHNTSETVICATRYGNVVGTRGSVVPLFINKIKNNQPITITDPEMTRFIMSMSEAIDLVLFAFENGKNGDIFVKKAPAANIKNFSDAICKFMNVESPKIKFIGTRHGEKLYESLLSKEEVLRSDDMGDYFRINPDLRDMNYEKFISFGENEISSISDYNSHNTRQLNIDEIVSFLDKIKDELLN